MICLRFILYKKKKIIEEYVKIIMLQDCVIKNKCVNRK